MMKRFVLSAFAALMMTWGAQAQWQTPNHSVPIGRGAGITGFKSVGPCLLGQIILGAGASADPTCGDISSVIGVLPAANGGTGLSSYTIGDMIYASGTTTLAKRAAVAANQPLISYGVGVAPDYSGAGLQYDPTNRFLRDGELTATGGCAFAVPNAPLDVCTAGNSFAAIGYGTKPLAQFSETESYAMGSAFHDTVNIISTRGSGGTGSRTALNTTLSSRFAGAGDFMVGGTFIGHNTGNTGSGDTASGIYEPLNSYVWIDSTAAPTTQAVSFEADTDIRATVVRKVGLEIVDIGTSVGHGSSIDAAILLQAATGAGYGTGISFGFIGTNQIAAVLPTGTLISTPTGQTYARGINFQSTTFSSNVIDLTGGTLEAAAFASPGALIGGGSGTSQTVLTPFTPPTFGGTWQTNSIFTGSFTGASHAGTLATFTVVRTSDGSGTNGPGTADESLFVTNQKTSPLTSVQQGELDGGYVVVEQGSLGDSAGLNIADYKVRGSGSDQGGGIGIEAQANHLAFTTGKLTASVDSVVAFQEGAAGMAGTAYGFSTEPRVGPVFAAYIGVDRTDLTQPSGTGVAITFTNASPTVISAANHGLAVGTPVQFNPITGSVGITVSTTYYVSLTGFGLNSFSISDTKVHALAGTNNINTTGSGTGTVFPTATLQYLLYGAAQRNTATAYFYVTATGNVDGSGLIRSSGGTAALPTLSSIADTTTGPYFPTTAQYAISISGVQRWLMTTSLITSTLPITAPSINLSGTSNQLVFQSAGVTGTLSWAPSSTNKTITLPNGTTDFTATGGASQVVKQVSAGAALTVGQLATTDLTGLGTGVATALAVNTDSNGAFAVVIARGAKALATGAISSAACTSAQTATATGTLTTDVVQASFNGDPTGTTGYVPLTNGMLTIIAYPTADTVNFKVCNLTSGSITPGAITLNWRVTR